MTSHLLTMLTALTLGGCSNDADTGSTQLAQAIVDSARSSHFFDEPFPSDTRLTAKGHPNLTGFPLTPSEITRDIISGLSLIHISEPTRPY